METKNIEKRYSELAETTCCLSCGGAIEHAKVSPGEICADLGSGRGTDVIRLVTEAGAEGFAYGIDIAEGMLKKARKQAEKLEVPNVEFIKSDLETLPLDDRRIDVIISNCTINHISDKHAIWSEVFRVLKPGGRFVVSDIYSMEDVPAEYKNDPMAVAECWAGAVTKDSYMDTLVETGFSDLAIVEQSAPYEKGKITVASFTVTGRRPVE